MKKFLLILTLALLTGFSSKAQDDGNDKIRDKMREFIQKRLDLTRNEAERFTPVLSATSENGNRPYKKPEVMFLFDNKKLLILGSGTAREFREIVGEKRSNDVFKQQDIFVREIREMREEQIKARRSEIPNKQFRNLIQ